MKALNAREKVLALSVGGVVLLVVNFLVLQFFWENYQRIEKDTARKTTELKTMQTLVANTGPWKEREAWLLEKQPKLENEATAGDQLLRQVKGLAQQQGLMIEQQALTDPERLPQYTAVTVTLETKSPWEAMVRFLHAVQAPGEFLVVDNANLRIDPTDSTQMRGQWRVSKWYAPQ